MQSIKYEGRIPATLRMYCDRHRHQIQEVIWCASLCDHGGYEAVLRNGWRKIDDIVHSLTDPNCKGLIIQLKGIVECDCAECVALLEAQPKRVHFGFTRSEVEHLESADY
jgi:hypothetical protein